MRRWFRNRQTEGSGSHPQHEGRLREPHVTPWNAAAHYAQFRPHACPQAIAGFENGFSAASISYRRAAGTFGTPKTGNTLPNRRRMK